MDAADVAEYRLYLNRLSDGDLVMELVTAHDALMGAGDENRPTALDRYLAAKDVTLRRMDYEKGGKKS